MMEKVHKPSDSESLMHLNYIPEANFFKYLGIIIRSDLSWAEQVHYMVQIAWRALQFVMHIVKRANKNTKSLA
jgi:hypothetical protein